MHLRIASDYSCHQLNIDDCRYSLLRMLYDKALDDGLFAESNVLMGIGAFEGCFETTEEETEHYTTFINDFYRATGKKFLGECGGKVDESPDNYAPDPNLPKEEYEQALIDVFYAARDGAWEADDWELCTTERDYELRLNYAQFLGLNAGMNAWRDWLMEMTTSESDSDEVYEEFAQAADEYYIERFYELVDGIRKLEALGDE